MGRTSLLAGDRREATLSLCLVGLSYGAAWFIWASKSHSLPRRQRSHLWLVTEMISCHLLVRSKSQVPSILRRRGLCKGVSTRRHGSLESILEAACHIVWLIKGSLSIWLLLLIMRSQDTYREQCLPNPVLSNSRVLWDGDICPRSEEFERH